MDKFAPKIRSSIMRSVKSRGNLSTELRLITLFKFHKIRGWRRNYPLYGKPDFVFLEKRIVVFTDGCFWHGHSCKKNLPENNRDYWKNKICTNIKRDRMVSKALREKGWAVLRIYECKLKRNKLPKKILRHFV